MRFSDFLRAAVLLSAGSATALAAVTVLAASREYDSVLVFVSLGWWLLATVIGLRFETRAHDGIARLMATARHQTMLPELRPGLTLVNRLWLLLVVTVVAGAVGALVPQVPSALGTCGTSAPTAPATTVTTSSSHSRLTSVSPGRSSGSIVW